MTAWLSIFRNSTVGAVVSIALTQSAPAQLPAKQRPFDRVPGILIACAPAPGFAWTEEACNHIVAEVKKRAALSKLPVAAVESTPDLSSKKFDTLNSFDGDKAIRMRWICTESKDVKGRVTVALASNVIHEPSAKDFPNQPNIQIAPGQRIPMNFFSMQVMFDPGVKLRDAQSPLKQILDAFFELGEGTL